MTGRAGERLAWLLNQPVGDAVFVSFEEFGGVAVDDDFLDGVTALNRIDDVLPLGGFTEDGVLAVEVWRRTVSDEKLGAVGVWTGISHGEDAGLVVTTVRLALTLELVAGVPSAISIRASALNHEVGNDAVEGQSIVKSTRGEVQEGANGDGCIIGEEGEVDVALAGLDCNFNVVHVGDNLARNERLKRPYRQPARS